MYDAARIKRYAEEDAAERHLCRSAERLLMGIDSGINIFDRDEFSTLVKYMLPEREWKDAECYGRFTVGDACIYRVTGRLVSLSDLARETGIPQQTLWVRVSKLRVPHIKRLGKKLYDIADLTEALLKKTA